MDPYEKLANAIIVQAATDYKNAVKFLKAHPHTTELDTTVKQQIVERKARIRERREKKLPAVSEGKSAEEKLLNRILLCEERVADTESFFLSDWIGMLTKLDGALLLKRIKETEAE